MEGSRIGDLSATRLRDEAARDQLEAGVAARRARGGLGSGLRRRGGDVAATGSVQRERCGRDAFDIRGKGVHAAASPSLDLGRAEP
jgi:hypothetical protein